MKSEVRPGRSLEEVLQSVTITTPQTEAAEEIDSIFPEGLRSRVLEYVQFQTTARMDDLGMFVTGCDAWHIANFYHSESSLRCELKYSFGPW